MIQKEPNESSTAEAVKAGRRTDQYHCYSIKAGVNLMIYDCVFY